MIFSSTTATRTTLVSLGLMFALTACDDVTMLGIVELRYSNERARLIAPSQQSAGEPFTVSVGEPFDGEVIDVPFTIEVF
jgi:hypothetical protein